MGDRNPNTNERISSLIDGRVPAEDSEFTFDALLQDPQTVQTWHIYQVVGDVMRSPELAPCRDDFAFLERLQKRLVQEPDGVRCDSDAAGLGDGGRIPGVPVPSHHIASNAPVFRWKALASVSFAALLGVVVSTLWMQSGQRNNPEFAAMNPSISLPSAVVSDVGTEPMLRDPQLDELMAAHRQLGGHSALQVPTGFLRNATYEGIGR